MNLPKPISGEPKSLTIIGNFLMHQLIPVAILHKIKTVSGGKKGLYEQNHILAEQQHITKTKKKYEM